MSVIKSRSLKSNMIVRRVMNASFRGGLAALSVIVLLSLSGLVCRAASPAVVVVQSADIKPFDKARDGFESACGCTIADIIVADSDRTDIAGSIRRLNPDGVLAIGLDALAKLQSVRDIPLFYTMTAGTGHPYQELKNLSGATMFISPERQLQAIKEMLPGVRRIGLIYDARHTSVLADRAIQYAGAHSLEMIARNVASPREALSQLEGMKGKIDVLMMLPDVTVISRETIDGMLLFSFRNRVPIFTFSEKYVEMGALAALTVDPFDLGSQTGEIARKVLQGRGGAVRAYARKQVLSINLKVAQKMGISIPEAVLKRSVAIK